MNRFETMDRVAKHVASYYAARVYSAEHSDLMQEAWLHMLTAAGCYNGPESGFASYVFTAASRNLSSYTRKQTSPVSCLSHRVGCLKGMHRADIDWSEHELQKTQESPEAIALKSEGTHEVKAIRVELWCRMVDVYADCNESKNEAELEGALDVIMEGEKPAHAAEVAGIPVRALYRTTAWFKRRCTKDAVLVDLLAQLNERREYIGIEEAQ